MLVSVITHPEEIEASRPFADIFEFRLDFLKEIPKATLPVMFTFRKKAQGGALDIPEEERLMRLEKLLEAQPEFCDLEADTDPQWIERLAKKFPRVKFVGSYHNFTETPADLEGLYHSMQRPPFTFYKIAAFANRATDMLRLFEFAKRKKNLAWISMGKAGQPSRVLGPLTGSPFCYATLKEETPPLFQIDLKTLVQLYRIRNLNLETKIFALIGNPVDASIGHLYHNQVFAEKKENAVYVKIPVLQEELDALFNYFRKLPFVGISVTMPYKTAVIPLLDELDADAEKIGAVNTILFKSGKAFGYNTDGLGAADAVERHLPVKRKKIALLGAGGAARAVAYELVRRGADVTIFNRTFETGSKLAIYLGCRASPLEDLYAEKFDVLINLVPHPEEYLDRLKLPPFVMDAAVSVQETPLLQKAKAQGCHFIDAKEMFYEQALRQQKIWH